MKALTKLSLLMGVIVLTMSALAGCHTVQGAGEDIQQGGKAITRAAE